MEGFGITQAGTERIQAIFAKYLEINSVIMYGSRAMGNYKPASDIDLALRGRNIDLSLLTRIAFDLDDLLFPFKFDLTVYDKISNTDLREHIKHKGKLLYERNKVTALGV